VGRDTLPVRSGPDDQSLLAALREIAEEENLVDAAERLDPDFPAVADLLRRAGKNS
jgi:hypothetical protein